MVPNGIEGASGDTVMDSRTDSVTIRVVAPVIPPSEAVINVSPAVSVYAIPVSSMVAKAGALEGHATVFVRSFDVDSL